MLERFNKLTMGEVLELLFALVVVGRTVCFPECFFTFYDGISGTTVQPAGWVSSVDTASPWEPKGVSESVRKMRVRPCLPVLGVSCHDIESGFKDESRLVSPCLPSRDIHWTSDYNTGVAWVRAECPFPHKINKYSSDGTSPRSRTSPFCALKGKRAYRWLGGGVQGREVRGINS